MFALFSITVGTLYQKHFVQPTDVRSANAIQLAAALLVTLPFAFMETEAIVWNAEFMGAMAWSVLALTLGGSSLLYLLIQRGAATSVTSLLYLVPPTTAVMAWAAVWRIHHAGDRCRHGAHGIGREPGGTAREAAGCVVFQGSSWNCATRKSISSRMRRGESVR